MPETRKLATILSLDVAGYSRAAERDDSAAAQGVRSVRAMITEVVAPFDGRIFSSAGDGFMLEFPSATAGVQAAIALLKRDESEERTLPQIRIGLHLGEVMVEENGDLLGHGVNVAARLQALADPGTAMVSEAVRAQVRTTTPLPFADQGRVQLDKMSEKVAVFSLSPDRKIAFGKLTRRRVTRGLLIAGAVVTPLAALGVWRFATPHAAVAATPALAVLPFANLTGHADDIAFAEGLHDDLLTRLGSITAIRVIARTSVLSYAGTTKRVSQIARELGVDDVLEGSVQRAGHRVRVAVQLIDGATDTQRWSQTYDKALTADNLFAIQREMTEAIAQTLNTVLSTREMDFAFSAGTHNLEAYEAYARGIVLLRRAAPGSDSGYKRAIAAFDQAIALDLNFAAAYAQKVYALSCSFESFVPGLGVDRQQRDAARTALDRLRTLAPDAPLTNYAFAAYFYWGFLDFTQALQHLDQALAAAPNDADIWTLKALITRRAGRFGESIAAFDRAMVLDPLDADAILNCAVLRSNVGDFAHATALIARARAIDSTSTLLRNFAALNRYYQGDAPGAWEEIRDVRAASTADTRLFMAIATRSVANIQLALRDWPLSARHPPSFPELYDVWRAISLRALGHSVEERRVLLQVKARLDASRQPYPAGWYSAITPDVVPGLLGDLAGVRAAEHDFLAHGPHDALRRTEVYNQFGVSFVWAGDQNRAAYYLGEAASIVGPSFYLRASIDPMLDAIRDHPGYLTLKRQYEAWAATRD